MPFHLPPGKISSSVSQTPQYTRKKSEDKINSAPGKQSTKGEVRIAESKTARRLGF